MPAPRACLRRTPRHWSSPCAVGMRGASRWLAVTAGPPAAEDVLREAIAAGAARAVRVDLPATSPSNVVASALAGVLADLDATSAWCGDHSLDRGSGSVPAYLAAELARPRRSGWSRSRSPRCRGVRPAAAGSRSAGAAGGGRRRSALGGRLGGAAPAGPPGRGRGRAARGASIGRTRPGRPPGRRRRSVRSGPGPVSCRPPGGDRARPHRRPHRHRQDQGPQRGGDPRARRRRSATPGGADVLGLRPPELTCASPSTARPAGSGAGAAGRIAADRLPAGAGRTACDRRHRAGHEPPPSAHGWSTACSTPAPPTPGRRAAVRPRRRHRIVPVHGHDPEPTARPRRGGDPGRGTTPAMPPVAVAAAYHLCATTPTRAGRAPARPACRPRPPRCSPSSTQTASRSRAGWGPARPFR